MKINKLLKICVLLFLVFLLVGFKSKIKEPIIFVYRDEKLLINVVLDRVDNKKEVYFGKVRIANLSNKKLTFMPNKIVLENENNVYPVWIDCIASVIFVFEPNEIGEEKIFFEKIPKDIKFKKLILKIKDKTFNFRE